MTQKKSPYFRNVLSEFVYLRSYSRWMDEEQRRETWPETIRRFTNFMQEQLGEQLSAKQYHEIYEAILNQEVMPSMRLLQFAGKAVHSTNVCAYNCAYIAPQNLKDFAEVMYISMCGAGVGFSVESQNIQQLPVIKKQTGTLLPTHTIADSKIGWAKAYTLGIETWFAGNDIRFDYSQLREAGSRLKTFGGKSSGPEPLKILMDYTRDMILNHQGRRLSNLQAHDLLCKIGEVVAAGGVRRSAMISLSDLDDVEMRDAKKGYFYHSDPQRSLANNSAVYEVKPDNQTLLSEWLALIESKSGERGIFNRHSLLSQLPDRRKKYFLQEGLIQDDKITGMIGTNPCGEIILRSKQFCNLTEIIARPEDSEISLLRKIRLASIIGTFQATLTRFPFLSKEWQKNCEDEALLGVSISGIWDCKAIRNKAVLEALKHEVIHTNKTYAKRFGIKPANATTCVKPSGTVSQVVDCASGIHPRFAPYYIRRIRISANDALFHLLKKQGAPYKPEVWQTTDTSTYVLEFPVKAPTKSIFQKDLTALEQLATWKLIKECFTEHNPSVTILVREHEWIPVLHWLNENWNIVGGLSFLPYQEHVYKLTPYEEITKEEYEDLLKRFEHVDFSELLQFEKEDNTILKHELACFSGICDV